MTQTSNLKDLLAVLLKHLDNKALYDLIAVMIVLIAVKQLLLPASLLLAGPASTFVAMIIATLLLRRRELSWTDLGLRKPVGIVNTFAMTVVSFMTIALIATLMGWFTGLFFEKVGDSNRFANVEGNFGVFMMMMFLVWTHGSIFEELLFRAFMINRASTYLGGGIKAGLAGAVFSSVFFGYRHYYYQGVAGAIITGSIGFGLSLLYLWFGRKNIVPLILGHGLVNTISQLQRFLGDDSD